MSNSANIRKALMTGVMASPFASLPFAQANTDFDKPLQGSPWGRVSIITSSPTVATLGYEGQDRHSGILQLDLNYPLHQGEGEVTEMYDLVAGFFTAGKRLLYEGTEVIVQSCGRTAGREVDGWWRVPISIQWFSFVPRH